jgi:hypothetical protein
MKFTTRNLLLVTMTVAMALAVGGCSSGNTRTKKKAVFVLSENREEAESKLLSEIPLGTGMEEAGKALKARGFRVFEGSPDEFSAQLDRPKSGRVRCNWLVTIKGEKGAVREISVEVAYPGP